MNGEAARITDNGSLATSDPIVIVGETTRSRISSPSHTPPSERLQSIDLLRGADMFLIMGTDKFFYALAKATGWTWAVAMARELSHSEWTGFTVYDLIQPLFLFITGVTLPLSVSRRLARGQTRLDIFRRLLIRALLLIVLGILDKNGPVSFDLAHLRFGGVLQRVGEAGLIAGVILMFASPRAQVLWVVGLLAGYWALLNFATAPGQLAPTLDQGRNIVDYLDQRFMPGRLIYGNHDAEGWFAMPAVVATVLIGALAGSWILAASSVARKAAGLAAAGAVLVGAGALWSLEFPISKHLWTSSYVLFAGGWSCLLLALFHGVVDGLGWRRWGFPFLLIGMNPLVIYVLTRTKLIDFPYIAKFFFGFAFMHVSTAIAPLCLIPCEMALEFAFLYWLYRKHFFWRV